MHETTVWNRHNCSGTLFAGGQNRFTDGLLWLTCKIKLYAYEVLESIRRIPCKIKLYGCQCGKNAFRLNNTQLFKTAGD